MQLWLRQFPGDVSPGRAPAPAPWRQSWWVQLDCFSFLRLEDTFLSQRKQPFQGFLRARGGGEGGPGLEWRRASGRWVRGGQEGRLCPGQERARQAQLGGWLLNHPTEGGRGYPLWESKAFLPDPFLALPWLLPGG